MRALVLLGALAGAAAADPPTAAPTGLAVGVEVGQPTTATVRFAAVDGTLGVGVGVGSGTLDGTGLTVRGGVTFAPVVAMRSASHALPIYLGVGGRYYRHHYDPASIDELADRHVGLEGTLGAALALRGHGLEVYLDGGPGYDVDRTDSCSFMSGVDSLCPHQQSTRLYWHAALGVRWYLGVGR